MLSTRWNFEHGPPVNRGYLNLRTQGRFGECDWYPAVNIAAYSFEKGVTPHARDNVKITWGRSLDAGIPFAGKTDARTRLNSRGNFNLQVLGSSHPALSMANRAFL